MNEREDKNHLRSCLNEMILLLSIFAIFSLLLLNFLFLYWNV